MPRFRKKPVVIDAEPVAFLHHLASTNWSALPKWVAEAYEVGTLLFANHPSRIEVRTLEGVMTANAEDMLIRGVQGEIYPCKSSIFAETYELVSEED